MTAFHVTLIVLDVVAAAQLAAVPVGAAGRTVAWLSPLLPAAGCTAQFDAASATGSPRRMHGPATSKRTSERETQCFSRPRPSSDRSTGLETDGDQLVQASVAGVVVEVAAPPVAVMPVSDGREK